MKETFFLFAFLLLPFAVHAAECPLTDASAAHDIPIAPQPGYLQPAKQPVLGCETQRIVGDPTDKLPDGREWGTNARHQYSKNQPWNADQSLVAVKAAGKIYLLDGSTYKPVENQCDSRIVTLWHPTLPNIRIKNWGDTLAWRDIERCEVVKRWSLPFIADAIGSWEGNPSLDGRFIAMGDTTGVDSAGRTFSRKVVIVDMERDKVGPEIDVHQECKDSGATACYVGWPSVSPSGKYLVVHFYHRSPEGKLVGQTGKRVYEINPDTLTVTPRVYDRPLPEERNPGADSKKGYVFSAGHADMGFDAEGNEVLVGTTHWSLKGKVLDGKLLGGITAVRLDTGEIVPLTDSKNEAPPSHVSLRNYQRPGWAYVTYHPARPDQGQKFSGEIVAVALDGSKRVERIAHHHSVREDVYNAEPHSVPSPDGKHVIFASDWAERCSSPCGIFKETFQSYAVANRPTTQPDPIPEPPPQPDPSEDLAKLREQVEQLQATLVNLESSLAEREEELAALSLEVESQRSKLDAIRAVLEE